MRQVINFPKFYFLAGLLFCLVANANGQTGIVQSSNGQNDNEFFVSEYVHIQEGAKVYVMGDVVIASNAAQLENEGRLQIQGNFILAPGAILKSFNGTVVMKNNHVNQNMPQYLEGDFTGFNALPKLVINKNAEDGVVYLKNGNLEIAKKLRINSGRLRTGPHGHDSGADYPYHVRILNDNPNAIIGHALGNSKTNYIEGKLQRAVGLGPYFFPVGPQPSQGEGIEPFEMNFLSPPPSDILGYYDNGTSTPIGSVVNCVFDQIPPIGDDDDDNQAVGSQTDFMQTEQYQVDCVAGQWMVEGLSLVYFYDIRFFPSQRILGQCNFESFFMAKNGIVENICPINEYALYEQKFLGSFDIPGRAGAGLNFTNDLAYLQTHSDDNPSLQNVDSWGVKNSTLEIQDDRLSSNLEFFPNPVSVGDTEISFEVKESGPLNISLYDNTGVCIARKKINATPGVNKVNLLPKIIAPGIYHLTMHDHLNSHSGRLAVIQ